MNCLDCALSKRYAETKGTFAHQVYCTELKRGVHHNALCEQYIEGKPKIVTIVNKRGKCTRCGYSALAHNLKGMRAKTCGEFTQASNVRQLSLVEVERLQFIRPSTLE